LTRLGGGAVGFSASAAIVVGVTVVTLTNSAGTETVAGGSLRDGRYTLTIVASQVTVNGLPLDGNGDGTGGDNFVFADSGAATGNQLYRLFGDATGDRVVNGADFGLFRTAFGTTSADAAYNAAFDVNNDRVINGADFTPFR